MQVGSTRWVWALALERLLGLVSGGLVSGGVVIGMGGCVAICVEAGAATYTFPTFDLNVSATDPVGYTPTFKALVGAPAGTYTWYTARVNWSPVSGDPFSIEAGAALTSAASFSTPATFYASPGVSATATSDSVAKTLRFGGPLDESYQGGNPLYFSGLQIFNGSSANWASITVSISANPVHYTPFGGTTTGFPLWNRPAVGRANLDAAANAVPYRLVPFYVSTSGEYSISVTPSNTADSTSFLYSGNFSASTPLTNVKGTIDSPFNGLGTTDGPNVMTLSANTQYYIAVSGFSNTDAGVFSGSIASIAGTATIGFTASARPGQAAKLLTTDLAGLTASTFTDLGNNDAIVKGTSEASVRSLIASWWNEGLRNGATGLGTSYTGDTLTTLAAVAEGSDVRVKYTYLGDTNLDGRVDSTDIANWVSGLRGLGTGWAFGDTNYDGFVDATDYSNLLMALRFQGTVFEDSSAGNTGVVPEPSALVLLSVFGFAARRRVRG